MSFWFYEFACLAFVISVVVNLHGFHMGFSGSSNGFLELMVSDNGFINMDVASTLAPPDILITRDQFNGSWRAWCGKGLSTLNRSMSWGAPLDRDIVLDLLRWQWKLEV
jgi:hypothetical protein